MGRNMAMAMVAVSPGIQPNRMPTRVPTKTHMMAEGLSRTAEMPCMIIV